jgi:hypothetical protein
VGISPCKAAVTELSQLEEPIGERISEITSGAGIAALIDNVGRPLTGDIISVKQREVS